MCLFTTKLQRELSPPPVEERKNRESFRLENGIGALKNDGNDLIIRFVKTKRADVLLFYGQ